MGAASDRVESQYFVGSFSPSGHSTSSHSPAAAGTRWEPIERFWRLDRLWRRRGHGKQLAGADYIGLACGTGEQAVMADAVEAMWQDMEQEAANELVRRERHQALPLRTIAAVTGRERTGGLEQSSIRNLHSLLHSVVAVFDPSDLRRRPRRSSQALTTSGSQQRRLALSCNECQR